MPKQMHLSHVDKQVIKIIVDDQDFEVFFFFVKLKIIVTYYDLIYFKISKTVVNKNGFNFKIKTVVADYSFKLEIKIVFTNYSFNAIKIT